MSCVDALALEIIKLLREGKSRGEIARMYNHEDADLVGEAIVEAESIRTWGETCVEEANGSRPEPDRRIDSRPTN